MAISSSQFMHLPEIKRIAVIRRNGFGDLLCTTPLLQLLKEKFPLSSLTLLVNQSNASILPYMNFHEERIIFPKGNKYFSILGTAYRLRSKKFDLAISAKTSPMKLMNFFLFALKAKQTVAFIDASWHSSLVSKGIPYNEKEKRLKHQALKSLNLLDPSFKEVPEKFYPKIKIPLKEHESYKKQMQDKIYPLHGKGPLIFISASYNRLSSNPGEDGYCNILNRLYKTHSFQTLISSMSKNREEAEKISKKLLCPSIVIENDDFSSFVNLLQISDIVFTGDGGAMHIAASLGKAQVALFGETSLKEWRPLNSRAICLHDPVHVNNINKEHIMRALIQLINMTKYYE